MTQEKNTEKHDVDKAADHLDNKELIEKIADENDDIFKGLVNK